MFLVLAALLAAGSPQTRAEKLAAHIIKVYPGAKPYAAELASRIVIESRRHGMRAQDLAAVAWIESDYRRNLRGTAGEYGLFQVMPREHGIETAWQWLQAHPAEFPIVKRWPGRSWRKMGKRRIAVLTDIRAGTYIAAYSIQRHVKLCRRLGHRVGKFRCSKPYIRDCPRYHPHRIDRIGHFNSGWRWPKAHYLRKLRYRSRLIKRRLR
jgi:hypothetical protein